MSNYRYSWRHGWKWALKTRTFLGFLRVMWLSYALGWDSESCQTCGKRYVLWWADDELYKLVHKSTAGLLCPNCFDREANENHISLRWKPEVVK